MYGKQWRDFEGVDQLEQVIEDIKNSPDSRRLIVSAWNPKDIPVMIKSGLPPCHTLFQFYVSNGRLSCQLYQRSADVFLGVPYNISSYALLTLMIAKVTGLEPGEFVHSFGDTHIYLNHLEQVEEQLSREPHSLPQLKIKNNRNSLFEFQINDNIFKSLGRIKVEDAKKNTYEFSQIYINTLTKINSLHKFKSKLSSYLFLLIIPSFLTGILNNN